MAQILKYSDSSKSFSNLKVFSDYEKKKELKWNVHVQKKILVEDGKKRLWKMIINKIFLQFLNSHLELSLKYA